MFNRVTIGTLLKTVIMTLGVAVIVMLSLTAWESWSRLATASQAEAAANAVNFVVAKARFGDGLNDVVWHRVKRVIGRRIERTAAVAQSAKGEVRGITAGREGSGRIFDRRSQPEVIVEVTDEANACLPRPTEADGILRINGHGHSFGAIINAILGFGD